MKTLFIRTLLILLSIASYLPQAHATSSATSSPIIRKATAAEMVYTIIDVQGSRFSDRMWLFTEATCSHNFDNGWDGYKMFGSTVTPQLFAMEADGNYQVNTVNDINDTYLGFLAGEDSVYTLTFTHTLLETKYQHLYLVDLLENKTIDIYATGTQYTFIAAQTIVPVKRFKIITTSQEVPVVIDSVVIPQDTIIAPVVIPVIPIDTVIVDPVIDPIVIPVIDPVIEPGINPKDSKNPKEPKNHDKKIKIYSNKNTIIVENPCCNNGNLKIYNAVTGRVIKDLQFNADGITTLPTDLPKGIYVANGITPTNAESTRIVIR